MGVWGLGGFGGSEGGEIGGGFHFQKLPGMKIFLAALYMSIVCIYSI